MWESRVTNASCAVVLGHPAAFCADHGRPTLFSVIMSGAEVLWGEHGYSRRLVRKSWVTKVFSVVSRPHQGFVCGTHG